MERPDAAAGPESPGARRPLERGDVPRLRGMLRALRRGAGESLLLTGAPESGKSAVLVSWEEAAWREETVLPLAIAVPAGGTTAAAFAADVVEDFASRCLAFRTRSARAGGGGGIAELLAGLHSCWPEAAEVLAEGAGRLARLAPGCSPTVAVSQLPSRLARRTGVPVICLCDDLHNLGALGPDGAGWSPEAVVSPVAPWLLACREGSPVARWIGPAAASVRRIRLGPLPERAAEQLLRQLAFSSGLELGEEARGCALALTDGWPQYLVRLVRALAAGAGTGPLDVARAYGASVAGGDLAAFWMARLAEAIPSRAVRSVALEILAYCQRDGVDPPDAGRLAALMFRGEEEVDAALEGLERAGVARVECRRVRVEPDPVLRDAVRALNRTEFGGALPDAVAAEAAAEAVRAVGAAAERRRRRDLRAALRAVLEAWDGREAPAALFDAAAFAAGRPAGGAGGGARGTEEGQDRVTLPHVVAVSSGRVGVTTSPAGLEMDAVAWGWRGPPGDPSGEVVWVAREFPGGEGTAADVREFDRAVAALQAAGDLPQARVVRWAVLGAAPDPAGAAAARELRVPTTTLEGLRALAGLFGLQVRVPGPAGRPAPATELEIEMTIPAAADAELVAARALEQVAELAALGTEESGRVRTAVVEACINAFEHSGVAGSRVRLAFTVAGDELRIRVENRGRPLSALALAPPGEGGGRRRGWGLRLMRELMDRVELEPRDDGVTLVMTKRLPGRREP